MNPHHVIRCARLPRRSRLWLALVLPLGLVCGASAQIKTDNSLGLAQTLVGPAYVIPQSIGRLAGSNLFHSFEAFNILGGQSANFTVSTSNLANVISRVTGGTSSAINGQLKLSADIGTPNVLLGTPNFFFINPAGITFGAGASIDVPGAFHVSTANYIKFADGNFHADLGQTSSFSSAAPEAFGFLGTTRAPIGVVDGASLSGYGSQAISIVAGDIEINGGTVSTESGAIRIAAVGQSVQEVAFTGALPAATGDLSILNYGSVYSQAFASDDAGTISISAGAITMSTGFVYSEAYDSGKAGNIDLSATGAMWILDGSRVSSAANWLGDAGSVTLGASHITIDNGYVYSDTYSSGHAARVEVLASADLWVQNGASISSSSYGTGHGGLVHIGAANITLDGASIHTDAYYRGNAGGIDLETTGALWLTNGASIYSGAHAIGDAGSVSVVAASLVADNGAAIYNDVFFNARGNAGTIEVSVQGELSLNSGGRISSITNGSGNAGSVKVGADNIQIDAEYYSYTGILSTTGYYVSGNAGNIEVNATHGIAIYNGGTISSGTNGSGNAGSVKVVAGSITLDQGTISSDTTYDTGNAANVEVAVSGNISIAGGATISSISDFSDGNAGSVKVRAGSINIDGQGYGAGISSTANYYGNAGGVEVTATGDISIVGRGYIWSSTDGSSDAALVKVVARNLLVDRSSVASSTSGAYANSANIEVTLGGDLSLKNGGFIRSVSDSYQGNAGSVTVRAESIAIDGQSRQTGITSTTSGYGNAGNVDVRANGALSMNHGGRIASRTTGSGNSGAVTVEASSISIDGDDRYAGVDTGIFSEIGYYSEGNAGNISVTVHGKLSIFNAGLISSSTDYFSYGNGGDIKIVADSIEIDGQGSSSSTGVRATAATHSSGNAGKIEVTASTDLTLRNGGVISASSFSFGNSGTVTVNAANVSMDGQGNDMIPTGIFTDGTDGEGQLGNIQLDVTGSLSISNKAFITSATYGSADAGSIRIHAGSISIDGQGITTGIFSTAEPYSEGHGGNIEVTVANQLAISNAGVISSGTYSVGNAGSTVVKAGSIAIDGGGSALPLTGISSQSEIDSGGNAGSVEVIAAAGLSVRNGGQISSSTFSSGDAGQVNATAGSILIDGQGLRTGIFSDATAGTGHAGGVKVAAAGGISVLNAGAISSSTFTSGNAGAVNVTGQSITIDGEGGSIYPTGILSESVNGTGNAGSVAVEAATSLSIFSGGDISSSTFSSGNAGSVKVTAGSIVIDRRGNATFAGISSQANLDTTGNAGDIEVTATGNLGIFNGGQISSSTFSSGDAGSVKVSADSIVIDRQQGGFFTGISSDTNHGVGNAGRIAVAASGNLSILQGGEISSSTRSSGNAGSVLVSAGTLLVDGASSSINASAKSGSSGQTGNVTVAATGSITLSNSGSLSIQNDATVADPGTIVPTTLSVSAPDITLKDASITAASTGNVAASDIQIRFSNHLFLDPSSITTSANLGNGGSIGIFGGQLITLENSQITTSVLGQTGNGGDIMLNANTLILDTGFIQANTGATNASGGLVTINVQNLLASGNSLFTGGDVPYMFQPGVFGFNVIQAAAPTGLSGLVQITTPLLDVSGSLSGLSAQVIDTGGLARNPCQVTGGSSLAQSGRGGLPPSARGLLRSDPGFAALQSAQSPATETHARASLATAGCL